MTLCEKIEHVGGARLLAWLRSLEDYRLRSDLLEHVMFCPRCSQVHHDALSLAQINEEAQEAKTSWSEILFTPLMAWTARRAVPVPTYGATSAADSVEQEWSLQVFSKGKNPATITLVRDDSKTVVVKAESQDTDTAYALRGFSPGGKLLFDAEVGSDGIPVVTDLHGKLSRDSDIEIFELE